MKHSGYIGVERNKYGEEKQRYIWYSKYKKIINVECLYIDKRLYTLKHANQCVWIPSYR